ncbi:FAD-dependent oxidoreductase [Pseudonocardia sp.]|uniref:NAD(P)/FAD-dependent oxidoreductase n=1 Tax=Pseudonocardia sp. TaxID=60912 RepID=UPI0026064F26|nr:FAD-dependent oxidoreductase [Pseudonocardia sp.]
MSAAERPYVVVGAGMAGGRAAEMLALRGRGRGVVLVGGEAQRPYHRPPLSKELLGGGDPAEVYFRDATFYAARSVTLRLGVRAVGLDPSERVVALDDGTEVPYAAAVLAPGTRPRRLAVPGADLAGIHLLRTLADAAAVRAALRPGSRVVVVGGGFIGTEVAAAAVAAGAVVTVVEAGPAPLATVLGAEVGALLQDLHERTGVRFRTGRTVERVHGVDRVTAVELAGGESLPADLVVVGIGGTPDVDWLDGSGVDVDDGIVVDEHCRTSVPDVLAAGDAARWTHPGFGSLRIEHETHAQNQATAAARTLLGRPVAYRGLPHVWSDQGALALRWAGHVPSWDDVVITRGDRPDRLTAAYLRCGRVGAVLTVNEPERQLEAAGLLQDGPFPADLWQERRASA